ncbi:MAG: molecular chaperone TorD family protein [Planctomycetes bacterium]|nr:molecular chaperone TorD family protein [Planctomycetota bacterium]
MTGATVSPGTEIDQALCRGAIYDALALGLSPPTRDVLSRLAGDGVFETLADAAAVLDASVRLAGPDLSSCVQELAQAARIATPLGLERSHERLFGHTARGKISPYETEYGPGGVFHQETELADLGGFYRAFGLDIPPSRRERFDHMAAECEFLSFLACKEAYELVEGRTEARDAVRRAQKAFLRDHAGRFGRAFGQALSREADHPFYEALGSLCAAFLAWECQLAGVPSGPESLPLRLDEDPAVPMACGGCSLAALGQGDAPEAGEGA